MSQDYNNHFISANEVTCAEEDGHISYHVDRADCTHYWMCEGKHLFLKCFKLSLINNSIKISGERKHHMPCPANLVFNPNENVCDWIENVEHCKHLLPATPARK